MKYVFVIGFPRSGTTMLADLMSKGLNYSVTPETRFYEEIGSYRSVTKEKVKDKLRIKKNSIPNSNDGSSVLIKSIVEFGFLNLLFLYEIIKFIFLRSNKDLDLKVFILSLISIQLLRGAGYFNGGFLFFFLFIVFYNLNNKITIHK